MGTPEGIHDAIARICAWMVTHDAPLLAKNLAVGASPEAIARAEAQLGGLAVTLDHARLLREQQVANARLAATARELALLNEIAVAATADLELRPMLGRIVDAMHAPRFGWEVVAYIRIDRPRQRFVCEAVATALPTAIHVGYSRPFGSGVVGEVAATGRPILIDDVATWPNYVETLPGARSELCVPAIYRGEVVALLNLESPRPAALRDQVALVTTVAEQVAGAIASARLLDEVRAGTFAGSESGAGAPLGDFEATDAWCKSCLSMANQTSTDWIEFCRSGLPDDATRQDWAICDANKFKTTAERKGYCYNRGCDR